MCESDAGWAGAGFPLINDEPVPPRDAAGRTLWVTRARPKVDRIACPWVIRRFIDPDALFLFVAAPEVAGNPHVRVLITRDGGHCGFLSVSGPDFDGYWAERTAVEFLAGTV